MGPSPPRRPPSRRRDAGSAGGLYTLRLESTEPGFDATVLCEFHARLFEGNAYYLLFDAMLQGNIPANPPLRAWLFVRFQRRCWVLGVRIVALQSPVPTAQSLKPCLEMH